jgi:catechol 2,3-dioxygenase-like lactoylglutathione lyase family enzyme
MKTYPALAMLLAASAVPSAVLAEPASAISAPAMQPTIVGPALYVSDMARSLYFYRDILGMTVRMQFGPEDKPDVMVGFGGDPSKPCLLLLSDRSPTPRKIEHPHGFDRFVIMVDDTSGLAQKLRAAGFAASLPRDVHGTSTMLMITDPDGYQVEVIDTKPVKR